MYHPVCFQGSLPHRSHRWKRQICGFVCMGIKKGCFCPIFISCHHTCIFHVRKVRNETLKLHSPISPCIRSRLLLAFSLSTLFSHFSLLLPIKQHKEACRQLGRLGWKSSTWHNLALIFLVPSKSYVIKLKTRFQDSKLTYDEVRYEVFWRVTLSRFVN